MNLIKIMPCLDMKNGGAARAPPLKGNFFPTVTSSRRRP